MKIISAYSVDCEDQNHTIISSQCKGPDPSSATYAYSVECEDQNHTIITSQCKGPDPSSATYDSKTQGHQEMRILVYSSTGKQWGMFGHNSSDRLDPYVLLGKAEHEYEEVIELSRRANAWDTSPFRDDDLHGYGEEGYALMEVYQIIITSSNGPIDYPISCGKIFLRSDGSFYQIYRHAMDQERYNPNDGSLLLMPSNSGNYIYAIGCIYCDLTFTSHDGNEHRLSNCDDCYDENGYFDKLKLFPVKGFDWDVYRPKLKPQCDKPLSASFSDEDNNFTFTIYFSFFKLAILATVEVSLLLAEGEQVRVYGLISATNDLVIAPNCESILFLGEDSRQSVTLISGRPIPLAKSLLAVPRKSNLIIHLFLQTVENRKHFPTAKLVFPDQLDGTSLLYVQDKLQVKVTWNTRVALSDL